MYESFFGFSERPFTATPQAKRYFPGAASETARATLARCIQRAEGVGLLTGPAGTGKTLLCQVLAEQFRGGLEVALLTSGRLCTRRALLQAILFELGLPYRELDEGELRLSLVDHLSPRAETSEATIATISPGLLLIVDEAHTLPLRLLEELRLITNLVRNGQPCVRLVLAGGPRLEECFASPKLESFNQRVAARCYLEALDRAQTIDYVRHQIQQVQGQPERMFTADALEAVYHATDGIPRLVNQVCDHALLLAYADGISQLTAAVIEEAWSDLQQLPTPWNASQGAPARAEANGEESSGVVEFGNLDDELADNLPPAVPFRTVETGHPTELAAHGKLLGKIDDDSEDAAEDFHPAGSIKPELELVFQDAANPFREAFDEEEVVIDRYTTLESDALANRPLVRSAESRELAALLAPFANPQQPTVAIALATWPGGVPFEQKMPAAAGQNILNAGGKEKIVPSSSIPAPNTASVVSAAPPPPTTTGEIDDDLIVIEDSPEQTAVPAKNTAPRVRRQEYRRLFAQLRRR